MPHRTKMMQVNLLRSFAMCILLVTAVSCAKNKAYLVSSANKNINISDDYGKADAEILKIIAPYKAELDGEMDEQIGTLTGKMDKEKPNSPLLNFMGDALLDVARKKYPQKNIDGAVMNYGGIRVNSMQKGDLTVRKIFELMPFDNTMVLVEMDSIMVRKLYDRIAEYGGWPMSHGMSFDLADDKAMNGLGNNLPIQSKNNWLFAIPNYIAEGGDNCTFLLDAPKEDTGLLIRDILIEYVRDVKQIIPDTTHRINVKG